MDTLDSSPSSSVEGVVTNDIENATAHPIAKNEAQVCVIEVKNYTDDSNNDDEEIEFEEEEDIESNEDGESEHDELKEEEEKPVNNNKRYKCRHEQHKQDQLYKDDEMFCRPSSSACVQTVSCCLINTGTEQHATASLVDGTPITLDVQRPLSVTTQLQQNDRNAHLKRLKNLRKNIEYIEQTNWQYKSIDELIGHVESSD